MEEKPPIPTQPHSFSSNIFKPWWNWSLAWLTVSPSILSGGLWRCDRWARRYLQFRRCVEGQQHHLHRQQVLVLQDSVRGAGCATCLALGFPLCLCLFLPHLGGCALHQELPDRSAVLWALLCSVHTYLLRPTLWSGGKNVQWHPSGLAQGTPQGLRLTSNRTLALSSPYLWAS